MCDYRSLSSKEVARLKKQGCTCDDWSNITAAENFSTDRIWHAHFSGHIELGVFENEVRFPGGITRPAGITNATIHNCRIGNNVCIHKTGNYIANYIIEEGAAINNVDLLAVEGQSTFGNGTEVKVLNEAGGREIPIFDNLTAQIGYILACYRHRPEMVNRIKKMIADYTASVKSDMGLIGAGARVFNCRTIKNMRIGPAATVEGVNRLENGTINSKPEDPVYFGLGVIAENFIACSGSRVTDETLIFDCFVGQGTELAKQYSAENSVFFANCGGFHGEACSVFAGPYTVTHHKSTLLIAGLYSFLNAGSGTNQSNHLYKLGPVHQGVVERGSKTASDSYMLWPAKVGPFTVVMGRHYRNSDTSNLPFSYLIEHEDQSILVPGVNLRSAGTIRDARKWPKRDKRKDPEKLDFINFKLLSPYTIQKMLDGWHLLEELACTCGETSDYFTYHSVRINNSSARHGINFYRIGTNKFVGNCLIKRLEGERPGTNEQLREILKPDTDTGPGKWVDLAGLFAPQQCVTKLLDDIEQGNIESLSQITDAFKSMHDEYPRYEWAWVADILKRHYNRDVTAIDAEDVIELVNDWKKAVLELDDELYADAGKEFAPMAQTGFGIDGDGETRHKDFQQVRGSFEENSFAAEIQKHKVNKSRLGDELIARMKQIGKSEGE